MRAQGAERLSHGPLCEARRAARRVGVPVQGKGASNAKESAKGIDFSDYGRQSLQFDGLKHRFFGLRRGGVDVCLPGKRPHQITALVSLSLGFAAVAG